MSEVIDAQAIDKKLYTVVLSYPDYIATDEAEYYTGTISARSPDEALRRAREVASGLTDEEYDACDPEDLGLVVLLNGSCDVVLQHPYY